MVKLRNNTTLEIIETYYPEFLDQLSNKYRLMNIHPKDPSYPLTDYTKTTTQLLSDILNLIFVDADGKNSRTQNRYLENKLKGY